MVHFQRPKQNLGSCEDDDPTTPNPTPTPTPNPGNDDCKTCDTCIAIVGNPQSATDSHCAPCAMDGQSWYL